MNKIATKPMTIGHFAYFLTMSLIGLSCKFLMKD